MNTTRTRKALALVVLALTTSACSPTWWKTLPHKGTTPPIEHPIVCHQYPDGCTTSTTRPTPTTTPNTIILMEVDS